MATTVSINDTLVLDQTSGIQDDDGALAADLLALAEPFRTVLLGLSGSQTLSAGQLAFAASAKGAFSGSNYVTVSADGAAITNLFFSDPDGHALNGDQVIYDGSPLKTIDGDDIFLWSLGDGDIVIATTSSVSATDGEVVAAFYLDDAADNLSATIQMVTFIALDHPDDADPDDRVDWTDLLNVSAQGSLSFEFDTLESGKFLWVAVGSSTNGLLVTGKSLNVDASGNRVSGGANPSDAMNTSQGGSGATIGIDSQMFVPGETAVFTLVQGFDALGSGPDATGDNANEIDYDSYLNTNGAGVFISQKQGNTLLDLTIKVYEAGGGTTPEEGLAYIGAEPSGAFNDDTQVPVKTVTVLDASGDPVATWAVSPGAGQVASGATVDGVTVTITGNSIDVNGVDALYTVNWTVNDGDTFNRFQLNSDSGKFDVGRIDVTQGITITEPVGDSLFVDDDGPTVDIELKNTADLTVDESSLAPPAPVAPTDSITAGDLFTVVTEDFGTDGAGASGTEYELVLGADTSSGLFDTETQDEVILSINAAGTLISGKVDDGGLVDVFTISIDPVTGTVTLTQYRSMVNGDPTDDDEADTPLTLAAGTVSVQKTLTDGDDDSASDTVDISSIFKFEDDGPTQTDPGQDVDNLITDDTSITDSSIASTDDIFPELPNFGADGPRETDPVVISLRLDDLAPDDGDDPDSGLIDTETGEAIRFVTVGDDIVGYVDLDGDGAISVGEKVLANEAVRYSLVANGDAFDVTFSQSRAVYHELADTEVTVNTQTVLVQREAFDGDGDPAEMKDFDLGEITFILDDEPTIGPISDGLVDFEKDDFVTNSLAGVVGNDPNSAPYTLTSYTANLTVNGVDLQAVPDGDDTVGYWADTNGDTIFGNAGDTEYYRMVLGDQSGEGNYTFTVLIDPPPAFTEFNFDDLPSGSNLFGIVGDADAGLIIFGKTIGLKDDNTYIANLTQEVKTSQAGLHDTIGIESQMFDPGDAAYFTFVNDPDPNFTGLGLGSTEADDADNIRYGSTLENDSAFIRIAQLQGGKPPSMSIQVFNIDDDNPQGTAMLDARGINEAGMDPDIMAVRVYAADGVTLLESYSGGAEAGLSDAITISINGDGVATVSGFSTNYKIEWDADEDFDQTLITGVDGKFDIGGFGFLQGNDTPDQFLSFTAEVTDGDGDTASASWDIGIDGTGVFDDDHVDNVSII